MNFITTRYNNYQNKNPLYLLQNYIQACFEIIYALFAESFIGNLNRISFYFPMYIVQLWVKLLYTLKLFPFSYLQERVGVVPRLFDHKKLENI